MTVDAEGNLYFEAGEKLPLLSMYQPDPNNPLKFVPKFAFACKARYFIGTVKKCSKKFSFSWRCTKFVKSTSITECGKCDAPDKCGQEATPLSLKLPDGFIGELPKFFQRKDPNILGTEGR